MRIPNIFLSCLVKILFFLATFFYLSWLAILIMLFIKLIQTYLRIFVGSVPDHHNKVSYNLFAVGGSSCLEFVKTATFVKYSEIRCVCITKHAIISLPGS